jgi:hypothetical protein
VVAPANKSSTEEDDTSPAQFGGMIGDDEDDEVELSAIVNDKKSKRGGANDYVRISLIPVTRKLIDHSVFIY